VTKLTALALSSDLSLEVGAQRGDARQRASVSPREVTNLTNNEQFVVRFQYYIGFTHLDDLSLEVGAQREMCVKIG